MSWVAALRAWICYSTVDTKSSTDSSRRSDSGTPTSPPVSKHTLCQIDALHVTPHFFILFHLKYSGKRS